jgi:glycosyltransferase involved in cell wall biosynthesis
MESGINKKLKVVWICYFTNEEVQSLLPVWKYTDERQQWIPNIIKGFEDRNDFEIHVISPHNYLRRYTKITIRNIIYHFIPFGIPIVHRHWLHFFRADVYTNFFVFRRKVKKNVDKIKPDLITLSGAENAFYSSSVLNLKKDYPILIFIQGLIGQFRNESKKSAELRKRIYFEDEIINSFKYFCGEQDSSTYISKYNPDHVFFRIYFPVNEILITNTKDIGKKYDCIYFGRFEKSKGAPDFVKVISEIKKTKSDVKACIIGWGNLDQLKMLAGELKCIENIDFIGFVKSQKEVFEYVKASRVFLAPPYKERLSSTIRETMLLKVPIVAYATGGIPYVNEFDENIFLVETGDYKSMAEKALLLIEDKNVACRLAAKAYEFSLKEFSLKINTERMINAYHKILTTKN